MGIIWKRSNRGARAKGAIDHQEQSKRRSTRCADIGTAGAHRSRAVGAGAASQCASANHLTVIRARAELVRARTALVNAARGLVKSYGQRLPKCGTRQVSRELGAGLHAELREVLEPLLKEIESLNARIQEYEVRMEKIAKESYPPVELLKQVKGVETRAKNSRKWTSKTAFRIFRPYPAAVSATIGAPLGWHRWSHDVLHDRWEHTGHFIDGVQLSERGQQHDHHQRHQR
jgi:hypothetical protein